MSPRSKTQNEQIRIESIGKILDAAFRLMSEKGYDATSIADIAEEAKVSKGLMYNYYASKEDLLKALIDRSLGTGENFMVEIVSEDPAESLSKLFSWFFNELRTNTNEWRFLTSIMLQSAKFEFIKSHLNQKIDDYTHLFSSILTQLGVDDPEGEARIIGCIFDGIGIQYLVMGTGYPLDELEQYLKNKYCKKSA